MKKALILVIAALMVPGVALAAKPSKGPKTPPQTAYVLKGTLSAYTAYNAESMTNGSITILVQHANHHQTKNLKGQSLTFVVDKNTKISLEDGLSTITDGDRGVVKVRAAKHIPAADLASTLQAQPARQVVDQGVKQ
jgi:hypothetical protein